jgi:hypothetical protein
MLIGIEDRGGDVKGRFRRAGFAILVLAVLTGLYAGLRHYGARQHHQPEDRSISFGLAVAPPQSGTISPTLIAHRGDKVTILIRSELVGDLHLHGYDREVALEPGARASLAFQANRTGQFPIELHGPAGRHPDIAKLVVEP